MEGISDGARIVSFDFDQSRYTMPRTASGLDDRERLEAAARDFESLFIKQMLDSMRNTLNSEDRIVKSGMAGDIFEDMLYDEYAVLMAKTGGFGLADMIVDQFV